MRLDGTIVGKFGRAGKLLKEFGTVNAIDCRIENVLVGEVGNFRVQKLTLRLTRSTCGVRARRMSLACRPVHGSATDTRRLFFFEQHRRLARNVGADPFRVCRGHVTRETWHATR